MSNEYYNGGAVPAQGSPGSSSAMRAQFTAVMAGFDKLPQLSGNAGKVVVVNSAGDGLEATNTFTFNGIFDVNTATAAVRITQRGSGNALEVEDSTNPDTSPFVIDTSGVTIVGGPTAINAQGVVMPRLQVQDVSANAAAMVARFDANIEPARFTAAKSRGVTVGAHTIVQNGDVLAEYAALGSDGAKFVQGGHMRFLVGGAPGVDDMPTTWQLSLSQDGTATPAVMVTVDSQQRMVIGGSTPAFDSALRLVKQMAAATSVVLRSDGVISSGVNTLYAGYSSAPSTQAAAFSLARMEHFRADAV